MTQSLLNIQSPNGVLNHLKLLSFSGVEEISQLYRFELLVSSSQPKIAAEAVLKEPLTVIIELPNHGKRYFHGVVSQWIECGCGLSGLPLYRLTLMPTLWLLDLEQRYRTYQRKTIPELFREFMSDHQLYDVQYKLDNSYKRYPFLVQYAETSLSFLMRLLAEAHLYFYFEHAEKKTTLIVTDSIVATKKVTTDFLIDLKERAFYVDGEKNSKSEYLLKSENLTWFLLNEVASYGQIARLAHSAFDYSHEKLQHSHLEQSHHYENQTLIITTLDHCYPSAAKAITVNLQQGTVAGPEPKRPYVNVSAQGKIDFHWDEAKHDKKEASCWIPVAQPWAGPTRGFQWLPRVADTAWVGYLNGQVRDPIIIGSTFNAKESSSLYGLPADENKSGIKSTHHHIMLNDKPGQEKFSIHVGQDYNETTQNNKQTTISKSDTTIVEANEKIISKNSISIEAQNSLVFKTADSEIELNPDVLSVKGKAINID